MTKAKKMTEKEREELHEKISERQQLLEEALAGNIKSLFKMMIIAEMTTEEEVDRFEDEMIKLNGTNGNLQKGFLLGDD